MDFFTAISTVGDTRAVAKEFAYAFMQALISDPENWIERVSPQFVGHCFRSLNLNFNVSIEDFNRTQDHPYLDHNPHYIFDPPPNLMERLDEFLTQLPRMLSQVADHLAGKGENDHVHPLSCYLKLVVRWVRVVDAVGSDLQLNQFLCEPLARLSFSFLGGLVKLLPDYEDFQGLKEICESLTVVVRLGIFYQDTCPEIVPPMLEIFQQHYGAEKPVLDFVYTILSVVMTEDDSYIMAYEFLDSMLKQFKTKKQIDCLRSFSSELITGKYVILQFDTLERSQSKHLLLATLRYLMTLQRYLDSTEVFPKRFLEVLLQLVLRKQATCIVVASLAAKVYTALARRQFENEDWDIGQHILETYIKNPSSPRANVSFAQFRAELKRYLETISEHFEELMDFRFFCRLLCAPNVRMELSLIAAQSASILFERRMAEYSDPEARQQVDEFLCAWPHFLHTCFRQSGARPILLSIYGMIDFASVAECNATLLIKLEDCCLNSFLDDYTLTEGEMYDFYWHMSRSVDATGNILLHSTAARDLRDKIVELQADLSTTEAPISQELLEEYANAIRRLHAMLMANQLRPRHVSNLHETLVKCVLERPTQNENLTLYGSESLAAMLVLMHGSLREPNHEVATRIRGLAQQLKDFCTTELSNDRLDLKRAKFMFCSVLILHINQLPNASLDTAALDTIIELLASPPKDVQTADDLPPQEYVSDMYFIFRHLIKAVEIVLPSNRMWKILVQYKAAVPAMKYLDPEVEKLIDAIMEFRIDTYVNCLPIIQLHLYHESKAKKKASVALTAHVQLIDRNCAALDAWLMRYIVFKDTLSLLIKKMRFRRADLSASRNILLPLQHVLILVTDLHLHEEHFKSISGQMRSLEVEAMGTQEKAELESFRTEISVYLYKVQDDEGVLKALPQGPLNFWQHNALQDSSDSARPQVPQILITTHE
ncbi:uncharacterized protein LOC108022113 [Drosophila biarmipes]|uniref:uncharacterized protein LOC108022113 n=1 Tax=Drosophila biarmipes TaxID=125945 RepID=UPI001CDB2D2F|nr:uncharacterized protein LOC108022113 [Drosophila biarmipes]